jgi:hypothetical protein
METAYVVIMKVQMVRKRIHKKELWMITVYIVHMHHYSLDASPIVDDHTS